MKNENITPAQFVERWLPIEQRDKMNLEILVDGRVKTAVYSEYFASAIAFFEAHIRQETWREACEAQRAECVSHFSKICKDSHYDAAVIRNAPIPEIPKNDEK